MTEARQIDHIRALMADGEWRTIAEIAATVSAPEPSVSAQLRHLRKKRYGSYTIERQRQRRGAVGMHEYRMLP